MGKRSRRRHLVTSLAVGLVAVLCLPLWAADNLIPNPGFEDLNAQGWPQGWSIYNWGPEGSEGKSQLDSTEAAHGGKNSIAGVNVGTSARMGVYTHVPLKAGTYVLSLWAKAAAGETGAVRCYLASAYSRSYPVTDQWTQVSFRHAIQADVESAEINIQNCSGKAGTIWFDDVALEATKPIVHEIIPDTRPVAKQPKLLYFDAHLMGWADQAKEWKARGFSGAFISGIFGDIHDDPWAADKDPATRGLDDKLLQECKAANAKCLKAGIDSNALKVAFYRDLPDPFDEAGYAKITDNFREAARFARLAGFPCMAIDTEYTAYQFDPGWKGYDLKVHSVDDLSAKWRDLWSAIVAGMVREYPQVDLLVLPEGSVYYGQFWNDMFGGMIQGLIATKHTQGIHLFCEGSYQNRDAEGLKELAADVRETTARLLPADARRFWLQYGDVALGAWPLGYYRAITDKDGKFLGWSGHQELFGDKIVGSYADKGANYPLTEFQNQMAAVRTYSGKYTWIYGHGSTWWQITPEQDEKYKKASLQGYPSANYLLPTVKDIVEYYHATMAREVVK